MTLGRIARQIAEVLVFCLFLLFIPFLPRRAVVSTANWLGGVAFRHSTKIRRIAMANLDVAFKQSLSDAEKERILEASFRTFALVVVDILWFTVFTRRRISARVRFDSSFRHYFDARPVLAVTGHIGNWEILGQSAALHGEPPASVAAPLDNAVVDILLNRMRQRTGQIVIQKEGAIRRLLRILKDGGRVALLIDQNTLPQDGGEFVDLFGLPAAMTKAPEMLASRTGAKVVFCYCVADENGDYTAYALPLGPQESGGTQAMASALETIIRKYPGQWLWMYKRWKYIPAGTAPDMYPFYARKTECQNQLEEKE